MFGDKLKVKRVPTIRVVKVGWALVLLMVGAVSPAMNNQLAHGQEPKSAIDTPKGFDVVSVRPVRETGADDNIIGREDGYDLKNTSIVKMLAIAYDVREDQVVGAPRWAHSEKFDVLA